MKLFAAFFWLPDGEHMLAIQSQSEASAKTAAKANFDRNPEIRWSGEVVLSEPGHIERERKRIEMKYPTRIKLSRITDRASPKVFEHGWMVPGSRQKKQVITPDSKDWGEYASYGQ
jgi:hypothetical protein